MKVPARLHFLAHEGGEDAVGGDGVLDLDSQQAAHLGVHGGFPELFRVHLAQAFVALNAQVLPDLVEQPVEGLLEVVGGGLRIAPADFGAFADQAGEDFRGARNWS
jgi:hypothetical protein